MQDDSPRDEDDDLSDIQDGAPTTPPNMYGDEPLQDTMRQEQEVKDIAMSLKEKLNGYNQLHKVKTKEDSNELFGSITLQNIIDKMKEDGHVIEKKQINLPSGAIKELGTYRANISLHPEVACDIEIIAEKSEDTEETV